MADEMEPDELQLLMEKSIKEALREVAKSAFEPEHGGGSQSIESVIRDVSSRVLKESGIQPKPSMGHVASRLILQEEELVKPMLSDLSAMPWVLWREPSSPTRQENFWNLVRRHSEVFQIEGSLTPPGDVEDGLVSPLVKSFKDKGLDHHEIILTGAPENESAPEDSSKAPEAAVPTQCFMTRQTSYEDKAEEAAQFEAVLAAEDRQSPPRCTSLRLGHLGGPKLVRNGLEINPNNSHLLMHWQQRPRTVLIIAKPRDPIVLATLQDMVVWLSSQGFVPILEPQLLSDQPQLRKLLGVRTFSTADKLERAVDLVITIGGDGTLTWAVSIFRRAGMPPALSFAAGSLGFLTPFPLDGWVRTLTHVLDVQNKKAPLPVVCRMRLQVKLSRRHGDPHNNSRRASPNNSGGPPSPALPPTQPDSFEFETFQCLNEVLVHRGNSGSLAKLDVSVDGEKVTLVQGDGVILATPTGSTAYSLAAGGSMVHPGVPGILLTPVSPHSLSFRPAILPDSASISIGVPLTARHGAALSIDGKDIAFLQLGDSIEVTMSAHPVPTICRHTETMDWFASVQEGLQWNGRVEQK